MTSFINLMASDVWSEADIVNRTESIVRGVFSANAELSLNRKIQGATLGQYTLTASEQAELQSFASVTSLAQLAGTASRSDAILLAAVMALETHTLRLALPLVEPVTVQGVEPDDEPVVSNADEVETDVVERLESETALANATEDQNVLFALRNPVPEVANNFGESLD